MTSSYEQTPQATGRLELRRGDTASIPLDSSRWQQDAQIVADMYLGSREAADSGRANPGEHMMFVDLRNAPKDGGGNSSCDGQMFDASVRLLAIDPLQLDWEKGTGYKGIRAGERVTFGRNQLTDRFPMSQQTVSGRHFDVMYNVETDSLDVTDSSTNGTYINYGNIFDRHNNSETGDRTEPLITRELTSRERNARTLKEGARILDPAEVARRAGEWRYDQRQPSMTHDMLAVDGLEPIMGIGIKDREFMFSGLFEEHDGRLHSICYSTDEYGRAIPRHFYKSKSDGGWRVSPWMQRNMDGDMAYGKGAVNIQRDGTYIEYGQYTQATKPDESISALLEEMERKQIIANPTSYGKTMFRSTLTEQRYHDDGVWSEFSDGLEVACVGGYGLDAYVSGAGFRETPRDVALGELEAMKLPDGFEPNFSLPPLRSYISEHTMLGQVEVNVFRSLLNGKPVEWHVAREVDTDTVWLDRITAASGEVSEYGTPRELILAGALNAKPVDYGSQTKGMVAGEDFTDMPGYPGYVSVKPVLEKMSWVKHYRRSLEPTPQHAEDMSRAYSSIEQAHKRRLDAIFAFPAPAGKDRFGNSRDERRVTTETSRKAADDAYFFLRDYELKDMIQQSEGTSDPTKDIQTLLRDDDQLRSAVGQYLLQKVSNMPGLPERVVSNSQKRPSTRGYDVVTDLSSREYAALLALSMLDGTYKPERTTSDPIDILAGEVMRGQHRFAAIELLGLEHTPYMDYQTLRQY